MKSIHMIMIMMMIWMMMVMIVGASKIEEGMLTKVGRAVHSLVNFFTSEDIFVLRSTGTFSYNVTVISSSFCFSGNGTFSPPCVVTTLSSFLGSLVCFNTTSCDPFTY